MWGTTIKHLTAAGALCSVASLSHAASMWIEPANPGETLLQGNVIQLDIYMDFTDDPTMGGGFDITYDSALMRYVDGSFLMSPSLLSDPQLTRDDNPQSSPNQQIDVDTSSGRIIGAAFGDLIGLTGPSQVGSLSFVAEEVGIAHFALSDTENPLVGGFYSTFTLSPQAVDFGSTDVQVVPLPAALWLMLSGLACVGVLGKRKSANT